jgi:hypothetical protein
MAYARHSGAALWPYATVTMAMPALRLIGPSIPWEGLGY